MAKTRLFGESISPEVIKQLERRAEVLSRGVRNSNDLRYLNEKTSWVRIISGVNTQEVGKEGYTSTSAKEFILSGGELEWDGKKFIRRRGFNTGNSEEERGRYNYDKDLGIRPEAGITSFNVKSIGTYGVLREALVEFSVWTRQDLQKAQDLFLRPGVSAIVEWGNAIHIKNSGNISDILEIAGENQYFNLNSSEKIAKILSENKINNSFNYDAFLGFVSNFTWSFRSDGGYDCSVKLVSKGAVLESLTAYRSTSDVISEMEGTPVQLTDNIDEQASKTYLHYFLKLVEKGNKFNLTLTEYIKNAAKFLREETTEKSPPIVVSYTSDGETKRNQSAIYVNLSTFFALVNISFGIKTPNGERITSFYTRNSDSNKLVEPKYVTFQDHFSLNPLYCVLPKIPAFSENVKVKGLTETIIDREKDTIESIYSIYVNLQETVKDLNTVIDSSNTPEKANVFDFIKIVLNKINSNLGEINSLDLTYDEDTLKWIVVDRNSFKAIPNSNTSTSEDVEQINITGLSSVVSNVSLEAKITPQLSSQIAISAQATNVNNSNVDLSLAQFNSNIVDRFAYKEEELIEYAEDQPRRYRSYKQILDESGNPIGLEVKTPEQRAAEERKKEQQEKADQQEAEKEKFINSIETAYIPLSETKVIRDANFVGRTDTFISIEATEALPDYNKSLFNKIKSESIVRFKNAIFGTVSKQDEESSIANGIIPVELKITLDGISGLKIGQVFRIGSPSKSSSILPDIYDFYGFVIVGLDSVVENSKWYTTVRGLTFRLGKDGIEVEGKFN